MSGGNTKHKMPSGEYLTIREARFVDNYMECGNLSESVKKAGYRTSTPNQWGSTLMKKPHIKREVEYRLQEESKMRTASANEVMEYLTRVMRGEEKDQFGLDAPLSERTKAAQELAKRTIDMAQKLEQSKGGELTIKLVRGDK